MKKLFFFLLLFCVSSISAQTFKYGDLYYYVTNTTNKTVRVNQHDDHKSLVNVTVPASVEYNGVSYSVTEIGNSAFYHNEMLQSITLPNSIITIGSSAFGYCEALRSIIIPNNVKTIGSSAFDDSSILESVTLPCTITSIGSNAFGWCYALKSVVITANSVQEYVNSSINNMLVNANMNSSAERHLVIDGVEMTHHLVIPDGTTKIQDNAFYNFKFINSISVPNTVTSIGSGAFVGIAYLHMNGATPPSLTASDIINAGALIVLPDAATLATYQSAPLWKDLKDRMVTKAELQVREVNVSAETSLSTLHRALGEENLISTIKLKVSGTINSYDLMLIRNKMLNLKYLDLSEAEVKACAYEYYTGYCSHDNMLENYAFSELKLRVVHLPKNLEKINDCFTNCKYLDSVFCQPNLQVIGTNTFKGCPVLRYVGLQEGLVTIDTYAFQNTPSLESITLPQSLEKINAYAFASSGLKSITIPQNVTTIGNNAFSSGNLETVTFAPKGKLSTIPSSMFRSQYKLHTIDWENTNITTISSEALSECTSFKLTHLPTHLKTIAGNAFYGCTAIDSIVLPRKLETIGESAFRNCSNVDLIKISSSVRKINNYAFYGCSKVTRVYTYTIEPTNILQQTFSCYHTADLYVPKTSYYNYYYNTQWSQFLKLIEFEEEYTYFYLYGDYYLGEEYGIITGKPDGDLFPGSGLIIIGDHPIEVNNLQYIGDGDIFPSIITDDNLNIDTLFLTLPQKKGKWHFLTFPFDVQREQILCNSEYVVRYYDGQIRANNGSGGWQNVPTGQKMLNGQGYIFQSANGDTLKFAFPKPKLPNKDVSIPLYTYTSENLWDANWNMVGNPYLSYYDLDSIKGFTYPVVTWNGVGYDTYRSGDDDYHFKPLESFFIQNVNLSNVTMPICGRETHTQMTNKTKHMPERREAAAQTHDISRWLVDITLSDSSYTDRTRVVFNNEASIEYEIGVDASKMMSGDAPVQLYSIGKSNEQYSINERPATVNGELIQLGYYAAYAGTFTLSISRMDTTFMIYDNVEKQYVDLSQGDYTFTTESGYNDTRFAMYAIEAPQSPSSLEDVQSHDLSNVTLLSITGQTIAENVNIYTTQLPAGVYMVKSKDKYFKIILK